MTELSVDFSENYDAVRQIMTHPRVWPAIGDDATPPVEEWQIPVDGSIRYVLVRAGGMPFAVYPFVRQNAVCWEMHACVLPSAWGRRALAAGKAAIAWMFAEQPDCHRIVASVPEFNRPAAYYGVRIGLEPYGVNWQSFLKDGRLHNHIQLGIGSGKYRRGNVPTGASVAAAATRGLHLVEPSGIYAAAAAAQERRAHARSNHRRYR